MRVRARNIDEALAKMPAHEAPFEPRGQVFLTEGKEYTVYALSVYKRVVSVLIVDDLRTQTFYLTRLFEVIDPKVGSDWICSTFPDDPVQLLLGPAYVAKDLESYGALLDCRQAQVDLFWRRINEGIVEPPWPGEGREES
jgi:hypothetical protein